VGEGGPNNQKQTSKPSLDYMLILCIDTRQALIDQVLRGIVLKIRKYFQIKFYFREG
jgi:hypothetical protein